MILYEFEGKQPVIAKSAFLFCYSLKIHSTIRKDFSIFNSRNSFFESSYQTMIRKEEVNGEIS